jgi:uncharacterized protein DUF2795
MDEAHREMFVPHACSQENRGALSRYIREPGGLRTRDMAHGSAKPRRIEGMSLIVGLVAGGLIGWLVNTWLHTKPWRVPKRRVTPIHVQTHLKGVDYPVGKHGLLERAQATGADTQVLETLTQLPEKRYTSPIEVSRELGKQA